jgi:excisionase family DNA binding protein
MPNLTIDLPDDLDECGLLTVRQVADIFGVKPKTIYVWIRDKGLPAYRLSQSERPSYWIKPGELMRWVETNFMSTKAKG